MTVDRPAAESVSVSKILKSTFPPGKMVVIVFFLLECDFVTTSNSAIISLHY